MIETLPLIAAGATRIGWKAVFPPTLRGSSGVEHTFGFLARGSGLMHAFDFQELATEQSMVAAFAKKFDTRADIIVVTTSGKASEGAKDLSSVYEIDIIAPPGISDFFRSASENGRKVNLGTLGHRSGRTRPLKGLQSQLLGARTIVRSTG